MDREENGAVEMGLELVEAGGVAGELVRFIEDGDDALFVRAEFGEHLDGGLVVVVDVGGIGI